MSPDYSTLSDPEIRYAVATEVMGWKLMCYETGEYGTKDNWLETASSTDGWCWEGRGGDGEAWQWDPTRDWNDTMMVVAASKSLELACALDDAGINSLKDFLGSRKQRTILIAALKAVRSSPSPNA